MFVSGGHRQEMHSNFWQHDAPEDTACVISRGSPEPMTTCIFCTLRIVVKIQGFLRTGLGSKCGCEYPLWMLEHARG